MNGLRVSRIGREKCESETAEEWNMIPALFRGATFKIYFFKKIFNLASYT